MAKFNNRKITTEEGTFDSKLEYERWLFLKEAEKKGLIRDLRKQVPFLLIPKIVKPKVVRLKTRWKETTQVVEKSCTYIADFTYQKREQIFGWQDEAKTDYGLVASGWVDVVEDTKGEGFRGKRFSTARPDFRIKKKLMLYKYGIEVKIVTKFNDSI